ncbi:DUF2073 domain-containing protein [Candidatus Woesearchaeota archaeon]|nr:DUF2073 domain-containing protein [Candidatus Woesearchaeota archaeon]
MLRLQFIPYTEIASLTSENKISKVLRIAKNNRIILLEGKFSPEEEALLIERTMSSINRRFKGIEICSVGDYSKEDWVNKIKKSLAKMLLGVNASGMTIIGPASIVKEIKRDPDKIELLTKNMR